MYQLLTSNLDTAIAYFNSQCSELVAEKKLKNALKNKGSRNSIELGKFKLKRDAESHEKIAIMQSAFKDGKEKGALMSPLTSVIKLVPINRGE